MLRILGYSVAGVMVVLLCVGLKAQESTDAQKELAALRMQVVSQAKRIDQLEAKAKAPTLTRAELVARDQKFYATTFADAKERARQPCRDEGGKFWVMVSLGPATTVSVSCEF